LSRQCVGSGYFFHQTSASLCPPSPSSPPCYRRPKTASYSVMGCLHGAHFHVDNLQHSGWSPHRGVKERQPLLPFHLWSLGQFLSHSPFRFSRHG
jgi:hypothetical protein